MGTSGVPLDLDKNLIISAIKNRKGVITHVCKDLNLAHSTVLKYVREDAELEQILHDARHEYDDVLCDIAENTILYCAGQREDLNVAIKSSMFALNNKGRKRGYKPPDSKNDEQLKPDEIREAVIRENSGATGISNASRPLLENQPSILDQEQRRKADQVQSQLGTEATMERSSSVQDSPESPPAGYNDVFVPFIP